MIEALLSRLSLSTKVIIALLVVMAIGWYAIKGLSKENTALVATNAVQGQTLKDAGATEALTEKTDAVTEESSVKTIQAVTKLDVDQKVVDNEVQKQVADIKREYADKPATPENIKQRADAISIARINGLWDTYCAGASNKDQTGCADRRNATGLPR